MAMVIRTITRFITVFLITALFLFISMYAQSPKLQISLDHLAGKAKETVDVNLDETMLQQASKFFSSIKLNDKSSPSKMPFDEEQIKKLIAGLKGIYVKSFQFEKEQQYNAADLNPVRTQLRQPGWSKMVEVHEEKEDVEIYTWIEEGKITGLAVIAAEPKELTVVNIVGLIDFDQLSGVGKQLGIPKLEFEPDATTRKKTRR